MGASAPHAGLVESRSGTITLWSLSLRPGRCSLNPGNHLPLKMWLLGLINLPSALALWFPLSVVSLREGSPGEPTFSSSAPDCSEVLKPAASTLLNSQLLSVIRRLRHTVRVPLALLMGIPAGISDSRLLSSLSYLACRCDVRSRRSSSASIINLQLWEACG